MKFGMKWFVSGLVFSTVSIASADVVRNPIDYGVFLELLPSVWGLLRRGQWSGPVHIGDTFHVRVESVNTEKQQIELSIVM